MKLNRYYIKKHIDAKSIKDALRREKEAVITDVWIDPECNKMESVECVKKVNIGF